MTDQSQMYAGKVSQTSILVYYKPDGLYNLSTLTLYEVIYQVVYFSVQDSVECSYGWGIPGFIP